MNTAKSLKESNHLREHITISIGSMNQIACNELQPSQPILNESKTIQAKKKWSKFVGEGGGITAAICSVAKRCDSIGCCARETQHVHRECRAAMFSVCRILRRVFTWPSSMNWNRPVKPRKRPSKLVFKKKKTNKQTTCWTSTIQPIQ